MTIPCWNKIIHSEKKKKLIFHFVVCNKNLLASVGYAKRLQIYDIFLFYYYHFSISQFIVLFVCAKQNGATTFE